MANILYYDNCWMTNIGEAFIDIGSRQLLDNVVCGEREHKILVNSPMTRWYLNSINSLSEKRKIYEKEMGGGDVFTQFQK